MIHKVVAEEYKGINILDICQKLKILWHFDIFFNTGPYESVNFKTILLQF